MHEVSECHPHIKRKKTNDIWIYNGTTVYVEFEFLSDFMKKKWQISNLYGIILEWNASISVLSDPILKEQMMSISQFLQCFIIKCYIHVFFLKDKRYSQSHLKLSAYPFFLKYFDMMDFKMDPSFSIGSIVISENSLVNSINSIIRQKSPIISWK